MEEKAKMKIGYLINQYPKVSHAFIRREVLAVEAAGHDVVRYSVRPGPENLVDAVDRDEAAKTHVLLTENPLKFLGALCASIFKTPGKFFCALKMALKMSRRSEAGLFKHLIYLVEACRMKQLIARDGVTHLHCHFGTNATAVALLCRELGGCSYSFTVHGQEEFDKPAAISLREKIEHCSFVVGISNYGRAQLYRWASPDHWPKIRMIRCGVDDAFLNGPTAPIPAAPRLVCVGRLCTEKGQVLLIDAAKKLADRGVHFELDLVGDGELRGLVEERIAKAGLQDRIKITGYVSSTRVREEIAAARAMVLPSFAEGLPVVIMEAFACGRPVISTSVAAIPELVDDGVNGWLISPASVEPLVNAMQAALELPADRLAEMGRAGMRQVRERHDINAEAARLVELFQGVFSTNINNATRTPESLLPSHLEPSPAKSPATPVKAA